MSAAEEVKLKSLLKDLFGKQRLAGLATTRAKEPYVNLVAFAATGDLKSILFATAKSGRKYANLMANREVALLVDNRTNRSADFRKGIAVTALGRAEELEGFWRSRFISVYLRKHPDLREFARSPDTSLFKVEVAVYYIVDKFQHVMELHVGG
jgi:nitroimidazol reductase NimA-like FMN-containing flavoprotein (pyridoxamine 5'-phosphate oxidase superfamily)